MSTSPLSDDVVAFVKAHVRSLLQLEALLLVLESRDRRRTLADLSAEMYVPVGALQGWLDGYAQNGWCTHDDDGYGPPEDAECYRILTQVSDAYVRRPVSVGRLIFGSSRDDLVSLADAFRLRKEP
jgi:hypothetical protein